MQHGFVNDVPLARFWRDLVAPFASRRNTVLVLTLAGLAGVIGPFGTFDAYPPATRFLYWLSIVATTAAVGPAPAAGLETVLEQRRVHVPLALAAVALVTAGPLCLVVALVNLAFGVNPFPDALPILYLQCAAVMGALVVLFHLAETTSAPERGQKASAAPAVLNHLPPAKRGRLLRLAAQDHYVVVVTEKGQALIAMRLRDAIADTSPEPGVQCHRSHWVALHAVEGRARREGRSGLRLSCGTFVPVGRTFEPDVKAALHAGALSRRPEDAASG